MTSASIIMIPNSIDVGSLEDLSWERDEANFSLKSLMQFGSKEFSVKGKTVHEALLVHEYVGLREELNELGKSGFTVDSDEAIIRKAAKIWITPKYIVVDRQENKPFVKKVINKGLNLAENTVYYLQLDTKKMAKDYPDHWARCFSDRDGRIDRGTVYGTKINHDSMFGKELSDATAKSIGVTTRYFGAPVNIRISSSGTVTIYKDIEPEHLIKFIESQILPYQIKLLD